MLRFATLSILFFSVTIVRAELPDRVGKGETQEYFDKNIKILTDGIAGAKKIVIYEGLPHQGWERKELEAELKNKKNIKLDGFPFYAEPIALKEDDAKQLSAIFSKAEAFHRYQGPKKCGGYHPDWCVEWKDGDAAYGAYFCFGCGEIRIYGPKNDVYCDGIPGDVAKILKTYRKNRPITKENP